jgi:ribonuclease R
MLVDGLIRMEDLGDDWWNVSIEHGEVRGERSGRRYRIGDPLAVQILSVNLPARQLNLAPLGQRPAGAAKPAPGAPGKPPGGKGPKVKGAQAVPPPQAHRKRKGRPGRRERLGARKHRKH